MPFRRAVMQSAYYFANCNGGNALGQYGACGLRHRRAIVPPVFHRSDIDMGDFKTARTLATSLLIAGLCISPDLLPLSVPTAYVASANGRSCNISGWSEAALDIGKKVTVRETPSAIGHISCRLPTGARHFVGSNAKHLVEFDIVGMHNGWFPIANVHRGFCGLSMIGCDDVSGN